MDKSDSSNDDDDDYILNEEQEEIKKTANGAYDAFVEDYEDKADNKDKQHDGGKADNKDKQHNVDKQHNEQQMEQQFTIDDAIRNPKKMTYIIGNRLKARRLTIAYLFEVAFGSPLEDK